MKSFSKTTIFLFLAIFALGGTAAVAKVAGYPQISDYAVGKANELAVEIAKAKAAAVSATEVSGTAAQ